MSNRARQLLRSAGVRLLTVITVVVISGMVCATLVRFAPGFDVDERELDPRLSRDSVLALRAQHESERNIAKFYASYIAGLAHGRFGTSHVFSKPIAELVKERAPASARNIGYGLVMAWSLALVFAFVAVVIQKPSADALLSAAGGALISLPAALVALLIVMMRKPASLAVAAVLLPLLYRYIRNILQRSWISPWITAARAKGLGRASILCRHVLPVAAPQLIALAGVSLNMAFSATLPVEVVADSPGIGQLAWQAALGRDLPLLVTLTGLVATTTLLANAGATLLNQAIQTEA